VPWKGVAKRTSHCPTKVDRSISNIVLYKLVAVQSFTTFVLSGASGDRARSHDWQ